MSRVDDVLRVAYLTTLAQAPVYLSTLNYATLGLSVAGTMASGSFTVEGTQDGQMWEELPIGQGSTRIANDEIVQPGVYVVNVAAYSQARVLPDNFTGSVRITSNVSTRFAPALN